MQNEDNGWSSVVTQQEVSLDYHREQLDLYSDLYNMEKLSSNPRETNPTETLCQDAWLGSCRSTPCTTVI